MKVVYQIPHLETVYAVRYIYEGYKNAFKDMGHEFRPYTAKDNLQNLLESFAPDIFISSLNSYNLKFLDLNLLKKYRKNGLALFMQIGPWNPQCDQFGAGGLRDRPSEIALIKNGLAGDIFFHWMQQDDPYMDGFSQATGYPFETILIAADKKRFFYEYDPQFACDIVFVGNYLPDKRKFFQQHLFPLINKYQVKIYGKDWSIKDRTLGFLQKIGRYFNIPILQSARSSAFQLALNDEHKVYSSSLISLNIHEEHQRKYGSDFNERTFKIMASGGFEICDHVEVLRRYFNEEELVIAENTRDWFDKIEHYIKYPDHRKRIIEKGQKKVLSEHTYHNRAQQMINLYQAVT